MRQQHLFLESEVVKSASRNVHLQIMISGHLLPCQLSSKLLRESMPSVSQKERGVPHECLNWTTPWRTTCSQENEADSDKSVRSANLPVATLWLPKIWCCLPLKNLPLQDLINKNEPWSKPDLYQPLLRREYAWLHLLRIEADLLQTFQSQVLHSEPGMRHSFWIYILPPIFGSKNNLPFCHNCENTVRAKQCKKECRVPFYCDLGNSNHFLAFSLH